MRKLLRNAVLAAACLSTAFAVPPETLAGPMIATPSDKAGLSAPIADVHYRRYRHYHPRRHYRGYHRYYRQPRHYRHYRRYGYDRGGALFASAALGIMGAGIAAATAPRWGYGYGGWGGPWGYSGWGPGYGRWGYGGGWGGYGGWW